MRVATIRKATASFGCYHIIGKMASVSLNLYFKFEHILSDVRILFIMVVEKSEFKCQQHKGNDEKPTYR